NAGSGPGVRGGGRSCHPGAVEDLEKLITDWLTLPEVALALDVDVSRVRRLIEDDQLVALRRGDPAVRSVPAELLVDGRIAPYLGGTVTVLRDGGFDDVELLTWLFTEDESLPGRPIDLLRSGQRGEVRRRAQTLARALPQVRTAARPPRWPEPPGPPALAGPLPRGPRPGPGSVRHARTAPAPPRRPRPRPRSAA